MRVDVAAGHQKVASNNLGEAMKWIAKGMAFLRKTKVASEEVSMALSSEETREAKAYRAALRLFVKENRATIKETVRQKCSGSCSRPMFNVEARRQYERSVTSRASSASGSSRSVADMLQGREREGATSGSEETKTGSEDAEIRGPGKRNVDRIEETIKFPLVLKFFADQQAKPSMIQP